MSDLNKQSPVVSESNDLEVLDFTSDPVTPGTVNIVSKPLETKSVEHKREDVRGFLALAVFWLLALILALLVFLYACQDKSIADIKELSILILTPIIGIVGTVFGFYFGSNK